MEKKVKKATVICGFPGIGKTFLAEHPLENLTVLDSDSSKFLWLDGERHPYWPQNYAKHILGNLDRVDLILVSSHKEVRAALRANHIDYAVVAPFMTERELWLERLRKRGSPTSFVDLVDKSWETWMNEIHEEYILYGVPTLRLTYTMYLSGIMKVVDRMMGGEES